MEVSKDGREGRTEVKEWWKRSKSKGQKCDGIGRKVQKVKR